MLKSLCRVTLFSVSLLFAGVAHAHGNDRNNPFSFGIATGEIETTDGSHSQATGFVVSLLYPFYDSESGPPTEPHYLIGLDLDSLSGAYTARKEKYEEFDRAQYTGIFLMGYRVLPINIVHNRVQLRLRGGVGASITTLQAGRLRWEDDTRFAWKIGTDLLWGSGNTKLITGLVWREGQSGFELAFLF